MDDKKICVHVALLFQRAEKVYAGQTQMPVFRCVCRAEGSSYDYKFATLLHSSNQSTHH